MAHWLSAQYPALQARAKAQGAVILWGDETAVKEDAHWVRGDAPRGQTPVLKTRARWDTLSMISAISARGEMAFQMLEGRFNAERFIAFLAAVIDGLKQKVFLIVDNLRVHRATLVTQWLAGKDDRIELVFLPPYSPQANPNEYLNRDFKSALRLGPVSHTTQELIAKAQAFMQRLTTTPAHVMAYFRHPAARCACSGI